MRLIIRYTCVLISVLFTFIQFGCNSAKKNSPPPNIVFILADDLGWPDVSCYGQDLWNTPGIDRLAKEGIRFTNAYAASPVCSATRASILTGKYPHRLSFTGITPHMAEGTQYKLPDNAEVYAAYMKKTLSANTSTFAYELRNAGYSTCFIGKWHLGGTKNQAKEMGFDHIHHFDPSNSQFRFNENGRFTTDLKGDAAIKFLEESKDKPFFMFFSANAVHTKIAASEDYINHYKEQGLPEKGPWNATYAGFVQHLDDNVERILDKLDELKISRNTVVFFFSDNGGRGLNISKNDPLRGGKGQLYEGGIREPLIIRWPDVIPSGKKIDVPVMSMDFYPTFLDIAGLDLQPENHKDGISLLPILKNDRKIDADRDKFFWHHPHYSSVAVPHSAIRMKDWKLIKYYTSYRRVWDSEKNKAIELQSAPLIELFDLKNDFRESKNLSSEHPEIVKELKKELEMHLDELNAEMPKKNPEYDPSKPQKGLFVY